MIEGGKKHQGNFIPYKNDEEFLRELEDVLLEDYFPWEIYIDKEILKNAMHNVDNFLLKLV